MNATAPRVAVIGGGISGLSAAHRLGELAPHLQVTLFEAAEAPGGVLGTTQRDGCLIERSADMFITRDPWALDLCRRIGFDRQLINTNAHHRKAFVVHRGRLVEVPEGFTLMSPARIGPILATPLLSWSGKLRLAGEYFVPRRQSTEDESLRDFSVRRFGLQAYERLIQPLIGGIYTADPTRLSMAATMKQFVDMERQYGSLIRGMRAAARRQTQAARPSPPSPSRADSTQPATPAGGAADRGATGGDAGRSRAGAPAGSPENSASGARYGLFVAPRDGMTSLVQAIAARLPPGSLRTRCPVTAVEPTADRGWRVAWQTPAGGEESERFDAVVIATPAPRASQLVKPWAEVLGAKLAAIPVAGAAIVVAAYRRADVTHPLDGFGFVVPLVERLRILSGSFGSVKFTGRAPDDLVLTRAFLGGACQPELLQWSDDELRRAAHEELQQLLGIRGSAVFSDVVRWQGTMPQYHVGHLDLVAEIERLAGDVPGLALAGNAYRGVGIPFCVRSGEAAAARLVDQFRAASA